MKLILFRCSGTTKAIDTLEMSVDGITQATELCRKYAKEAYLFSTDLEFETDDEVLDWVSFMMEHNRGQRIV